MIVARDNESLLLITQPDHARFSGEVLSLWRADGLPGNPRRAEILFAAREHDNGWREADAAPRWNAGQQRPHDFLTMPREERIEIWQRGTARFAGEHPYAALLIARHAANLHRGHRASGEDREQDGWGPFLDYLDELQSGLLEASAATEAGLAADYRLIDLADLISLAVCNRWTEAFERYGSRGSFSAGVLRLDPFPLAGTTTFRIPCRRIPDRAYRGDADLGGELAAARWGELSVKVAEMEA